MTEVTGGRVVVSNGAGGPLVVRGATEVEAEDGTVHPVTRPVVALCRCHRSERMPWCDSSHKVPRSQRTT